jgi:hypothetical protein
MDDEDTLLAVFSGRGASTHAHFRNIALRGRFVKVGGSKPATVSGNE